jgi:hypothetical protein
MKKGKIKKHSMFFSTNLKKKGQLTIFVMVAIVIVVVIVGYFLIEGSFGVDKSVSPEVSPLYDAVMDCVSDVTEDSIYEIGGSGGYFDLPEKVNSFSIPYYFYEDENLAPSLEVVEGEIAKYVEQMLFFCVEKVYSESPSYEVEGGEINVDVEIRKDDKVYFSIDYPFDIFKGNTSYFFEGSIKRVYDVRLYAIHGFVAEMMGWQKEEPRAICINCIYNRASELGLVVDMWDFSSDDVVFVVYDNQSIVKGSEYIFLFINKYERGGYDPFENL